MDWRLHFASTFSPFFSFSRIFSPQATTVHVRYMNSSRNFWPVFREQCIRALFTDPQISFFINFFIKNGFYSTIYTFKIYFATVISAISFQFQQNKSYLNRPLATSCCFTFQRVYNFSKGVHQSGRPFIGFFWEKSVE